MYKEWSKEVFAKNLKYYMTKTNKNQKEMAAIIGVSAPTFNEWLKGKKYPRIDKVEKLAQYFGILKSDLIEEKSIESHPEEMAERHFQIIMDADISEMFDDFKLLDETQRKIVKDLVRSLAQTKKTEA